MTIIKTQIKNTDIVKAKHKKITDAAVILFSKYGFHKTTMRQIAEASGIELSYLYKYISSKDDILLLFYEDLYERYFPIFESVEKKPDQNPVAQIIEVLESFFEKAQGYHRETMAAYRETKHLKKEHFKIILKKEKDYTDGFLKIIERGVKAGCFHVKDPLLSANFVAHMLMADIGRGWVYKKERSKKQIKDEWIRFILNALGCCEYDAVSIENS